MYGHTIQSPYITIHYHTLPYIDHHTYIHWSLHHPCFLFTENLNSVLDDNKLIILSNENLKYVTLTIIDRYDMVWFSEEVCTLEIIYTNYSETLKSMPLDYNEDVDSSVACRNESGTDEMVSPNLFTQCAVAQILEFL